MGLDKSKLGLHSLRAGGATAAANQGVCDRLLLTNESSHIGQIAK